MSGSIIRVKHKRGYTVIPNSTLRNTNLSLDATGLLARLLSRPDDWQVQFGPLRRESKVGRDRLRRILRELEAAGYLWRNRTRDHRGRWVWESVVSEEPIDGLSVYGRTGDGQSADGSGVDIPNHQDLPNTDKDTNYQPTSNSGGVVEKISSIPVPECLKMQTEDVRDLLRQAKPQDVVSIVEWVDRQVLLGMSGKRKPISSPYLYLKKLCVRSMKGEYQRDEAGNSQTQQDPEKKRLAELKSERMQLLSLIAGMKDLGMLEQIKPKEARLREIEIEMRSCNHKAI